MSHTEPVAFAPLPPYDPIRLVKTGKQIGVLMWAYNDGSAIVTLETGNWHVPPGSWKVFESEVKL